MFIVCGGSVRNGSYMAFGGCQDFIGIHSDEERAIQQAEHLVYGGALHWAHVFDTSTMKFIALSKKAPSHPKSAQRADECVIIDNWND